MRRFKGNWWLSFVVLALATLVGCPPETESSSSDGAGGGSELADLEGTINIDGSSTVFPITEAVTVAFGKEYPNIKVPVAVSGTGGGFKRFVKGETEISNASRPIKDGEFEQCIAADIAFVEVPVAYDGLSVVVNRGNDWCDELTVDDLMKIFLDDAQKPTTWKQVREEWPDEPLKMFIPGTDSGTFDYFKEVVVGKTEKSIRSDVSASEDDNVLVTGISNEKGGIGFFGCAYYFENADKLKALAIVNGDGKPVLPDADTIESGEYNPLSRPLFIYVNVDRLNRPEMKKFVEFYLEHAGEKASDVGYVALPSDVYDAARDHIASRKVGTHFMAADGEKRSGSVVDLYKDENLVEKLEK